MSKVYCFPLQWKHLSIPGETCSPCIQFVHIGKYHKLKDHEHEYCSILDVTRIAELEISNLPDINGVYANKPNWRSVYPTACTNV